VLIPWVMAGSQGEPVFTHKHVELDHERRIPRAGQPLVDPLLVTGGVREVPQESRVVQHDLTAAPAYVREVDQAVR